METQHNDKPYRPETILEKSINDAPSTEELDKFDSAESKFTAANIASLQAKLENYRQGAFKEGMDAIKLYSETHNSTDLGEYLRASGFKKPGVRWDAHHLISGKHRQASAARTILARDAIKMRVDDPYNGCWMPKTVQDAWPTQYKNAIPHENIHRKKYYDWLFGIIFTAGTIGEVQAVMLRVRAMLLTGNIKEELLENERAGAQDFIQDIDKVRYNKWRKMS